MRKLLCKPHDRAATEDKSNIADQIDCNNGDAGNFGKSKRPLESRSDEHKRSVRNCDFYKNETGENCWEKAQNIS